MALKVIDFYRKTGRKRSIFMAFLKDPVFYILVRINGKIKELTLKLSGDILCPSVPPLGCVDSEAHRNYMIIIDALTGKNRDRIRRDLGFSKREFREIIFQIYCILIFKHTTCSSLERVVLFLLGLWKFYIRKVLL